jgi:antitoxin component YwqK of YwqJK toxin-antitoxin module
MTTYDQNDVKISTCQLKNGKRKGTQTTFYPNSNKKSVWEITNEQPWCAIEYYSINGDSLFPGTLFFGTGSIYDYHDNAKVKTHGFYKHSLKDSIWTFYSKKGQIYLIETYKNGILTKSEKF